MQFQYSSDTEWMNEWTDATILPKAVKITIAIPDPVLDNILNWFTTSIRLPKA